MPEKLTERDLLHRVVTLAEEHGWRWFHEYDSRRTPRKDSMRNGFPDLVLVPPEGDTVYFVELKTEKGKLTASQAEWFRALCRSKKVFPMVWRPSDLPSIIERMAKKR